jgi:signal peptidase I
MPADTIRERPALLTTDLQQSGTEYGKRPSVDPFGEPGPKWWVAGLLALLSSGLGQLYNGRWFKGVASTLLPTALLFAAVVMGSPIFYLVAFWAGAFVAPTALVLLGALVGWVPIDHPAIWMGVPMKAVLVLEAVVDARRICRLRKWPITSRWSRFLYGGSLVLLLVLWIFSTGLAKVERSDMNPVLEPGDQVVIDRLAFGLQLPLIGVRLGGAPPERGDRVALMDPEGSGRVLVRRVFAMGGDRVSFGPPAGRARIRLPLLGRAGAAPSPVPWMHWPGPCVFALEVERRRPRSSYERCQAFVEWAGRRSYRVSYPLTPRDEAARPPWEGIVPRGRFFVLADNRGGRDSRDFGPVNGRLLRGRPHVVLWSHDPLEGIRWHRMGLKVSDQP